MEQPLNTPGKRKMVKVDLNPDKNLYANWTFSTYIRAGDFIYTNFMAANPNQEISGQTEECFRNLERTLAHAGATLEDVVRITILIRHRADFQAMDDVYKRQFSNGYPVRTTIFVSDFMDENSRIQLDAVAYKPEFETS